MNDKLITQITDLFMQAGEAHHQAFIDVDGADPEWAIWYAEYLIDKLPPLLDATLTKSEIVYLLILLDREVRTVAPGARWQRYYAKALVERYGK